MAIFQAVFGYFLQVSKIKKFSGVLVQLCRWWEAMTFWSWHSNPCFFTPGLQFWLLSWTPHTQGQLRKSPVSWFQHREQLPSHWLLGLVGVPRDSSKSPLLLSFHLCPNSVPLCLKLNGVCFKHQIQICTVNESHGKNEGKDHIEGKRVVRRRRCKRWGEGRDTFKWWLR